jgi:hypothetical protein
MLYDLYNVLLDSVSKYLFENFCIHVYQRNWSIIPFCTCPYPLLEIRIILFYRMSLVVLLPFLLYGIAGGA